MQTGAIKQQLVVPARWTFRNPCRSLSALGERVKSPAERGSIADRICSFSNHRLLKIQLIHPPEYFGQCFAGVTVRGCILPVWKKGYSP